MTREPKIEIRVVEPTVSTRLAWAVKDSATLARRDLIRTRRRPDTLMFGVVMGVFFLLLFDLVFGGVIEQGTGIDYTQFLVPGVLVITALTGSLTTGTGLSVDIAEGVNERFRSLPMSRIAVVAGRTLTDALRNAVAMALVIPLGYLLGFRYASLGGAIVGFLLILGIGFAFSWISASVALKLRDPEAVAMGSMFWLFPLMFASTVFTPAAAMPSWLKWFAEHQPISVVATAARGLANGNPVGADIVFALVWVVALLGVFVPLATHQYRNVR